MNEHKKCADWWCVYDPKTNLVRAVFDTEQERDEWIRSR